jgi:DNA-directed RNA polymerase specialized sigma24 family protein
MSEAEIPKGSVSGWIAKMRQGDAIAIGHLVSRYFRKISLFADSKLRRGVRVSDDGEDIAISVLQTITQNSADGQFPNLQDRDDLWLLMIVIAQHAVIDRQRTVMRRVPTHTMTDMLEKYNVDLDQFLGQEDSQRKALEIIECWDQLVKSLPDEEYREIVKQKMLGRSNRKIADTLQVTSKKVDRKVNQVLEMWQKYITNHFES